MMRLVVDNTKPIERPDLYAGFPANDDAVDQDAAVAAEVIASIGRAASVLLTLAFWIALGLVAGLCI